MTPKEWAKANNFNDGELRTMKRRGEIEVDSEGELTEGCVKTLKRKYRVSPPQLDSDMRPKWSNKNFGIFGYGARTGLR